MAIYSPLRLRRQVAQRAEAKQRLIVFQLQSVTFALALDSVVKVTTLERLYGDAAGTGAIFITYQGQEIAAIDVGAKIFGQSPMMIPALDELRTIDPLSHEGSYSIVLQSSDRGLIGLPIDSKPSISSIAYSLFIPFLEAHSPEQIDNLQCVKSIYPHEEQGSIHLLDTSLLLTI
jgi:chemotaxis signal transduction protein